MSAANADRRSEAIAAVLLLVALVALPFVAGPWVTNDVARTFSFVGLALSLAWVWGHCGLLCLGQAVFFGLGAYAMALVTLGRTPLPPSIGMGFGVACIVGVVSAFLIGTLLFASRRLGGVYFGIVTLAIAAIVQGLLAQAPALGASAGLSGVPAEAGGSFQPALLNYGFGLAWVTIAALVLLVCARSRWGLVLTAVRNHPERAAASGIFPPVERRRAFVLGAAVASVSGALFALQFNFVVPALAGFAQSAEAMIWVAVGGRRSVISAAMGALVVRLAETWLGGTLAEYWPLALGAAFIVVVMFAPDGLFGRLVGGRPRALPVQALP